MSESNSTSGCAADAWTASADALTEWAWARLVNRTDIWGAYWSEADRGVFVGSAGGKQRTWTAPRTEDRGRVFLTPDVLWRHFTATAAEHVVGLHTTSPANTSLWGATEVDWHGAMSPAPESLWKAVLAWYADLREIGFRPLLTDSNGKGGYHLRILFREAAPTANVWAFLRWLTGDHEGLGLAVRPECFPKQKAVTTKNPCGNWLRMPGRHAKREHWSRVWDGTGWLEGTQAVAFILSLDGDDPGLLLSPRIEAYLDKLPNRSEGQGRDDVGYRFACWLVRDMALSNEDARPWLERWDAGNSPPKGPAEISKWLANAHQYGQRPEGSGRKREKAKPAPCYPCSPGSGAYVIDQGRICRRRFDRDGGSFLEPLCNFTARITASVRVDDGAEVAHFFTVEGQLADGPPLPAATVPAQDFQTMNWVLPTWGVRAVVSPGQGAAAHLRTAIQLLSADAPERTVYRHTGWRQLGEQWGYLHAGGAITAAGLDAEVTVDLDGRLGGFRLPAPPEGEQLQQVVRASLSLLALTKAGITAPLLGAVYRAVLGGADFSLFLIGASGLGKSEVSALAQQHFGPGLDRLGLPGNWSSTANALESLAFLAKDALLAVDDFKPGGSRSEIDALHGKAERLLRAQGNSSGRQRCRPDGTVRADRPPRGLVLASGEDSPRGESLQARMLPVLVRKGDFDVRQLTPYQRQAAEGIYAAALSGYLQWLAGRYGELRASLPGEHRELRASAAGEGRHPRAPGIVADLAQGWKHFLTFAVDVGAITAAERDQLARQAWTGLLDAAAEQARELEARDPVRRFLELLSGAIASGRVHLCDPCGEAPAEPEAWGWRLEEFQTKDGTDAVRRPRGLQVGWVSGDDVYLDPDAVYAEVQRLAEAQGERLAVSKDQLYRRLKEAKLLASTEADKTTTRRALQGNPKRRVLHLHRVHLSGGEQGEQGEQGPAERNGHPQEDLRESLFRRTAGRTGGDDPETGGNGPCSCPQDGETGGGATQSDESSWEEAVPVPPVPPVDAGEDGGPDTHGDAWEG